MLIVIIMNKLITLFWALSESTDWKSVILVILRE